MSKPMKIAEALARIAKNRADEDALAVARQQIGTRAVIMLKAGTDDLLDPKETLDAMQHAAMLRVERIPGGITLEAWLAAARQDAEACPITGRPLYKGRVEVPRPGGLPPRVVDWSPVPAELRLVAAYRAELGVAVPPDLAVASLTAPQLPVEWERARQTPMNLSARIPSASDVDARRDAERAARRAAVAAAGYAAAASALRAKIAEAMALAPPRDPVLGRSGAWLKLLVLDGRLERTLVPGDRGRESAGFARADLVDAEFQMTRPRCSYPPAAAERVQEAIGLVADWPDSWPRAGKEVQS